MGVTPSDNVICGFVIGFISTYPGVKPEKSSNLVFCTLNEPPVSIHIPSKPEGSGSEPCGVNAK